MSARAVGLGGFDDRCDALSKRDELGPSVLLPVRVCARYVGDLIGCRGGGIVTRKKASQSAKAKVAE